MDDTSDTSDTNEGRRTFLKGALAGGTAAAGATLATLPAPVAAQPAAAPQDAGCMFFTPSEAALVEAACDHMIPADAHSPSGSAVGIPVYIDRALAGEWGNGDRLYLEGPWKPGVPTQGYQLPLTPAQLFRAGFTQTDAHCRKTYNKPFDGLTSEQKEAVLKGLDEGKITFANGLPSRTFFDMFYNSVMEGLFADPIYGGNRNKAGWKMIGFPGVIAIHARNISTYKNKPFPHEPKGIADVS
jgi:gluconate 2-dehydrogenase gamma chain